MPADRTTRLIAPRQIEYSTSERPVPGFGEVLLELSAVGVCGSDVHWYVDGRIGESALTDPLTLGHEPAGRVIEIGEGVDPALRGRRVAIEPAIPCMTCPFCLEGDTNICPNVLFMGTPPVDGAFREFMTHPAALVVPLPDQVNDEMGALLEPLAIAVHAVDLIKPRLASSYVIQGAGPIGLSCLLTVRMFAPGRVIVVEPLEYRRALALAMGADVVLSPDDPDAVKEVERLTGGYGADYVIEACGKPASFGQMVRFARPGAKVAVIGIDPHDRLHVPHSPARRKGLTLFLVRRSRHTLERAITLTARGHWRPEPMITHRRKLGALGPTLDMVAGYADGVVKAMIDPRA
jgi:L-iditol 2-dehydrogenase